MPQTDLTAVVEDRGTTRTISLEGALDEESAPTVDGLLVAAIADADVETVVVDLEGVSSIDSSGVAVLLGLHAHSAQADTRLVMLPAPPTVQRTLALCGVVERLPFATLSSEAEVFSGLGASRSGTR